MNNFLNKITAHNKTSFLEVLCLLVLFALFIVPQINQQLINGHLPGTGDMVHKRITYLFTNFPDYIPGAILSDASHSKMYHYDIALFNIMTGLTGEKSFEGFAVVNWVALGVMIFGIFAFAKRMSKKGALLAPLFFLSSSLLVFSFLGQADQHLIYLFFPLVLFVALFYGEGKREWLAIAILLGAALNSNFTTWIPIIFLIFIWELEYPKIPFLGLLALGGVLYSPFLIPPLSYLIGIEGEWLGWWGLVGSTILFAFFWLKKCEKMGGGRFFLMILLSILTVFAIIIPIEKSPLYYSLRDVISADSAFQGISLIDYIFVINSSKGIPGKVIFILGFSFFLISTIYLWKKHQKEIHEQEKKRLITLGWTLAIPFFLSFMKFTLLEVNYSVFIRSFLGYSHMGRICVFTFFLLPIPFIYLFGRYVSNSFQKGIVLLLGMAFLINIILISNFYYLRVSAWDQQEYQNMLQQALENGDGVTLTKTEALYSCHFYQHCDINTFSDVTF